MGCNYDLIAYVCIKHKYIAMKLNITLMCIVVAGFSLIACGPQTNAPVLLEDARLLLDSQPDSALKLIESIFYPERSLSKKQYMYYLVTCVKAKRINNKSIKEDTLIFEARDYFVKKKDATTAALASFYSGCVYFEQQNLTQAMQNYKKAEHFAIRTDDVDLKGLIQYNIGDLLADQNLYNEALEQYKLAEYWYAQSSEKSDEKQAQCLSAIGQMYALLNQFDNSIQSFKKGLDLVQNSKNNEVKSLLYQNLSVLYTRLKQNEKAKVNLRKSFLLDKDSTELPLYYLNFARIYTKIERSDTSVYYIEKLRESLDISDDPYFRASAYNFLADQEKARNNYEKALNYKDERIKAYHQIINKVKEQSVYEIKSKYDFEQLKNRYNQSQINMQLWVIFLLILIIIGGTAFTLYTQHKKNQLINVQRYQETLNRMNNELQLSIIQKKETLRNIMLEQLDITKKIIHLNKQFSEGLVRNNKIIEQINQILYGERNVEQQWEIIYLTFNKIHPGLSEKIQTKFSSLKQLEFRICILTYAEFKIDEIALVLNKKANTIQTLRTIIRKKIGAERGEDIATYLNRIL